MSNVQNLALLLRSFLLTLIYWHYIYSSDPRTDVIIDGKHTLVLLLSHLSIRRRLSSYLSPSLCPKLSCFNICLVVCSCWTLLNPFLSEELKVSLIDVALILSTILDTHRFFNCGHQILPFICSGSSFESFPKVIAHSQLQKCSVSIQCPTLTALTFLGSRETRMPINRATWNCWYLSIWVREKWRFQVV